MWGRTALFIAADALNFEAVKTLLRHGGADPTVKNFRGTSLPLYLPPSLSPSFLPS
jgi:ankyrin repeat protein